MEILKGLNALRSLPNGCVLSIGNFDGLHRGHQRILEVARQHRGEGNERKLAVATFEPHPLSVIRPEAAPPRLTPQGTKEAMLAAEGVDYLVVLPPEPGVLNLPAEEFWALLRDHVKPSWLVEGEEFNFGKSRGGDIEKLRQWTARSAVRLEVVGAVEVSLCDLTVVRVSSSLVRWLLRNGRARDAAICLGRPYALEGVVVVGYQRGRTIGVPTANLQCGPQLLPADGVYAGRCKVDGRVCAAAISIGTMPTFGENKRQVEAHLLGFSGDLYGRRLKVELVDWVRDQRKFNGVELLKAQLARDMEGVRERIGPDV